MKTRIFIVFFLPVICLAQTKQHAQPEKPATDACPTWDKKSKSASKAEYFEFLKSNKAKDNNRQTTYTTSTGGAYSITRTTSVEPRTARGKRNRANSSSVASKPEENTMSTSSNESIQEETKEEAVVAEKEMVSTEVKVEEVARKSEEKEVKSEEKNVAAANQSEKDKPSVNTEKLKHETKVTSRKVKRFFSRKNKGGKGKTAKCPDF